MIADSNLIILSGKPQHNYLRQWIVTVSPCVSAISKIDVLGCHRLSIEDRLDFEAVFSTLQIIAIDDTIIDKAISLRQSRKMSLGDAIIVANARRF